MYFKILLLLTTIYTVEGVIDTKKNSQNNNSIKVQIKKIIIHKQLSLPQTNGNLVPPWLNPTAIQWFSYTLKVNHFIFKSVVLVCF